MIERLGIKLGRYLFLKGYIEKNQIDAIRYYVEVLFNEYLQILLTVLIGFVINKPTVTIIYLILFITLRKYSGGYHANSIFKCNVISYTLYFISIFMYSYINPIITILLLIISGLYLVVGGKSTIISTNNHNKGHADKMLRIIIIIFTIIFLILHNYLALWSLVLFQVMMLNIINERSKDENYRNSC